MTRSASRGMILAAAVVAAGMASVAGQASAEPVAAGRFNDRLEDLAKTPGDTAAQREARRNVATVYYATAGMMERFPGDLKGIDLGKPVALATVDGGAIMYQFVRNGGRYLGNFFSPIQAVEPTCLGISGAGRTQVPATMPRANALRSIAAPIVDTWTTQGVAVPTEGGCAQVVVDDDAKKAATFTPPPVAR